MPRCLGGVAKAIKKGESIGHIGDLVISFHPIS
jgi:hypothetical protein